MATNSAPTSKKRRWLRRTLLGLLLIVILAGLFSWWYVHSTLTSSLPKLEGKLVVVAVGGRVQIERDEQGVPTIRAETPEDMMLGLGFVHAQDRFFQMDLLRRNAAGELAELIGGAALGTDQGNRIHRFRSRAVALLAGFDEATKRKLEKYAEGVNQGLRYGMQKEKAKPFVYHLLFQEPSAWKSEDCILAVYSMCLALQGGQAENEIGRYSLKQCLPEAVAEFLDREGTDWDAAIDGSTPKAYPIPPANVLDFRKKPTGKNLSLLRPEDDPASQPLSGSNSWAVGGKLTADGRAILANDMHLRLSIPNIWYRARLIWKEAGVERFACGVTLPGGPAVVVGSNGHIAWGFTNAEGDWSDLVPLTINPQNKNQYQTPTGFQDFIEKEESIHVKGGSPVKLKVKETIWGPVIGSDRQSRSFAQKWAIYEPGGVNFGLADLIYSTTLEGVISQAQNSGGPHQNFVCVDDKGRIGWTILGRIPKRIGLDGRYPSENWATGKAKWDGFLKPEEYPKVVEPKEHRLWTANNRVVGNETGAKVGRGGQDLGARAKQIRDDLLAAEKFNENDLLQIQLDDKAIFLMRWKELLLTHLKAPNFTSNPWAQEIEKAVTAWDGYARKESRAYHLVADYRAILTQLVLQPFREAMDPKKGFTRGWAGDRQREGVTWDLLSAKPPHLLNPRFANWEELFSDAVARLLRGTQSMGKPIAEQTWGERNAAKLQHPLSLGFPMLGKFLNPPEVPQSGAPTDMPRVAAPYHGSSQRIVVSPGKEELGIFQMPGGQSEHPMSPYYLKGHADWLEGKPAKFLPGATVHTFTLEPK